MVYCQDFRIFSNAWVFGKFQRNPVILETYQLPIHFGNFQNYYRYLRVVYFQDFGNFSNAWVFWKFLRYPGIWEIPSLDIFDNCCHSILGCYILIPNISNLCRKTGWYAKYAFSYLKIPRGLLTFNLFNNIVLVVSRIIENPCFLERISLIKSLLPKTNNFILFYIFDRCYGGNFATWMTWIQIRR